MTALTDSVTLLEEQLVKFDAAAQQLADSRTALEQTQLDVAAIVDNEASVADRAKKLTHQKSVSEILESDISRQELALAALRTQIVADSTDLRGRIRAEVGAKISDQIKEVSTQLQKDFDVRRILFPIDQVSIAHRSVLQLREIENSLYMLPPNDDRHIDFARRARTDYLGKLI